MTAVGFLVAHFLLTEGAFELRRAFARALGVIPPLEVIQTQRDLPRANITPRTRPHLFARHALAFGKVHIPTVNAIVGSQHASLRWIEHKEEEEEEEEEESCSSKQIKGE